MTQYLCNPVVLVPPGDAMPRTVSNMDILADELAWMTRQYGPIVVMRADRAGDIQGQDRKHVNAAHDALQKITYAEERKQT